MEFICSDVDCTTKAGLELVDLRNSVLRYHRKG